MEDSGRERRKRKGIEDKYQKGKRNATACGKIS
jgi:hypothetical protein